MYRASRNDMKYAFPEFVHSLGTQIPSQNMDVITVGVEHLTKSCPSD